MKTAHVVAVMAAMLAGASAAVTPLLGTDGKAIVTYDSGTDLFHGEVVRPFRSFIIPHQPIDIRTRRKRTWIRFAQSV